MCFSTSFASSSSGLVSSWLSGNWWMNTLRAPSTAAAFLIECSRCATRPVAPLLRLVSPSAKMTIETSAPASPCSRIVPPQPNTSSSPWAAKTTTRAPSSELGFDLVILDLDMVWSQSSSGARWSRALFRCRVQPVVHDRQRWNEFAKQLAVNRMRIFMIANRDPRLCETVFLQIVTTEGPRQIGRRPQPLAQGHDQVRLAARDIQLRCPHHRGGDGQFAKPELQLPVAEFGQAVGLAPITADKPVESIGKERRLAVVLLDSPQVLSFPVLGAVDFDVHEPFLKMPLAENRYGQPQRALRGLDPIPVGEAVLLELDAVQKDEEVACRYPVEIAEPRQVGRLMDTDNHDASDFARMVMASPQQNATNPA